MARTFGRVEWVAVGLTLLAALPFLTTAYPPIVDMPNHVARLFLECHRSDPALSAVYKVRIALIPNVSMDIVNAALCGVVSPSLVFKGIIALSLLAMTFAGIVIQRKTFGAPSVGLLVLPATALNRVTFMGYINYLSGVAVLFVMLALLVNKTEDRRTFWPVCVIGGVALFFCHIFALALGMVAVFGLQIGARWSFKDSLRYGLRTVAAFGPALALFAAAEKPAGHSSVDIGDKIFALVVPLLSGAFGQAAVLTPMVLVITLIGAIIARRRLVDRQFFVAAVLSTAFGLLLPFRIGDAIDIGARTLAAAIPLLALAIPPRPRSPTTALIAACCFVLLALHLQFQAAVWPRFGRQVAELRAALAEVPRGAKVLTVWGGSADVPQAVVSDAAYTHLAAYAVIDRAAFYPLEFTGRGMQPLTVPPALAPITPRATGPLTLETARALEHWQGPPNAKMIEAKVDYAADWPERFDRVVYLHLGDPPNFDEPRLATDHTGSFFSILSPKASVPADRPAG